MFAARDEAGVIEVAARTMLRLDYPDLGVIAVDDRSSDETGAILDLLAAEDSKLRAVHVNLLPDGWLGKTHALQRGLEYSRADWVLLTDADIRFEPTALRRAVSFAVREGVDHVAVAPVVETKSAGERLFLAAFQMGIIMYVPGWQVEEPGRRAAVGVGAFNLVKRESLLAIGGFERLSLSVDEDLQLGRTLKWSGRAARLLMGEGMVSVRWHEGVWGLIRGLEKNLFAVAGFRVSRVVVFVLGAYLTGVAPFVGLWVGPLWTRAVCAVGYFVSVFMVDQVGRQCGVRWYHALFLPVSAALNVFALLRSMWLTLARGGVVWRGHLYPLAQLRSHVKARRAWLRALWSSTR